VAFWTHGPQRRVHCAAPATLAPSYRPPAPGRRRPPRAAVFGPGGMGS